jgi:hypothetical protein
MHGSRLYCAKEEYDSLGYFVLNSSHSSGTVHSWLSGPQANSQNKGSVPCLVSRGHATILTILAKDLSRRPKHFQLASN